MPREHDDYGNAVDYSPHFVSNTPDVGGARILRCSDCGETYLSELRYVGSWRGRSSYYEYRRCQDCRSDEDGREVAELGEEDATVGFGWEDKE